MFKFIAKQDIFFRLSLVPGTTRLRCGGIINDYFVTRLLLSPLMKGFWKSVKVWQSYGQE